MKILSKALGLMLVIAAMSGVARADNSFQAPEIDAGTAGSCADATRRRHAHPQGPIPGQVTPGLVT